MMKVHVKRLHPDARLPEYAHATDAGCDLFLIEPITITSGERVVASTGIALAIPDGHVGLIWDKSSIATNMGIKTMGGVLDAGYRGEVKVILYNTSTSGVRLDAGQKIAQLLIQPIHQPQFEEVADLDETDRGTGGFGSTGAK